MGDTMTKRKPDTGRTKYPALERARTITTTNKQLRGNWSDQPCWYASIQDAGRTQVVLGPFRTESACREWAYRDENDGGSISHNKLVDIACKLDPKAWFYSWGMVKMENGHRDGILNKYVRTDGLWTGEPFEIVTTS